MEPELAALEERIEQLVQRLQALRAENRDLRQQLAARTDENARNAEKLAAARTRIEALLKQIPEKTLMASVEYLNRRMKEVRDTGKVVGNERIAIMAALNIAHELVSNPGKASSYAVDNTVIKRRIVAMQETLDAALAADQENLF